MVALIPARSGSKRIPGKNMALLGGKPLLQIAIQTALDSNVFNGVAVSSDSDEYLDHAFSWGAMPIKRPKEFSQDDSPDVEWVVHALKEYHFAKEFAILRPTNPFRTAETIMRAYSFFKLHPMASSMRAVQLCKEHPCKMWKIQDSGLMESYTHVMADFATWYRFKGHHHSQPYQVLPEVYVQNASLEMGYASIVHSTGSIAGCHVLPFITIGYEGFDINRLEDLILAEALIERGLASV